MYFGKEQASRMQLELRSMLDRYLSQGWIIESRDPIVISRGRQVKHLDKGLLKDGSPPTKS